MADFVYFYKSSDGVRHQGEMSAPKREDVFVALRKRGIKAIKVVAKDGSRENGEPPRVHRRRMWLLSAICLVTGALIVFAFTWKKDPEVPAKRGMKHYGIESNVVMVRTDGSRVARPRPRRFMQEFADGHSYTGCLNRASERLLARFAMPGEPLPNDLPPVTDSLTEDFYESLGEDIMVEPNDSPAVAELKGIVARLKDEAEVYLRTGKGLVDYIGYLRQRQQMEVRYRQEIIREYPEDESVGMLRAMGFRPSK